MRRLSLRRLPGRSSLLLLYFKPGNSVTKVSTTPYLTPVAPPGGSRSESLFEAWARRGRGGISAGLAAAACQLVGVAPPARAPVTTGRLGHRPRGTRAGS